MKVANDAWNIQPVREVRMPVLENQRTVTTASVDALWTDGGLRPNASNLAFIMQDIADLGELEQWKQRLKTLPVRASLLVSPDNLYLLQPSSDDSGNLEQQQLDLDGWRETLVSPKPHLFTPKELAKLRTGQLSLADLEEEVSERSLTFLLRQQKQVDEAFQQAIEAALKKAPKSSVSSSAEIKGHIIRFAIAYLAARILQDKNFFGSGDNIQVEDPITLLDRMVSLTNGFFKRARESAQYVDVQIRQELANYMGYRVSFVLTDHRDVGRLYERAIKKLPAPKQLDSEEWGDLNRHYTPVKIAERMLEALPLERLRPEERFIFDPAAGSGSLLLAATSRLADMTDIPVGEERKAYLRNHVAGNDKDEYAKLIAQLRYFLASESLGRADDISQITDVLPFPSDENFICEDYESLNTNDLPVKPKVIVANPPFQEKGKNQKAARFVEKALEWLDDGSQFAFILPQSFLAATTHGIPKARNLLAERCQILEVWQFPERSIGIDAEQAVCLVIGSVGQPKQITSVISRAVFSRVQEETKSIREQGFLGASWLTNFSDFYPINNEDENIDSEHQNNQHINDDLDKSDLGNLKFNSQFWKLTVAPPVPLRVPTIHLGNLFYAFNGVNPGKYNKKHPPEGERKPGIPYKRNWRLRYRDVNKLWADPQRVPKEERWIRYGKEYLEGYRPENEELFDLSKVLIARKVNRGSKFPLVAQWDETGFCPDNNIYCIVPADRVNKFNEGYQPTDSLPDGWHILSYKDKCLWLLGICTSKVANCLSLIGRKNHEITVDELCDLQLPFKIDSEIINVTRQIIDYERRRDLSLNQQIDALRQSLDRLVEESYGNPSWKEITRVGKSPDLDAWAIEQKKKTKTTIGQVLDISEDNNQVYMYISRLMDDDDAEGEWVPLPQELPGWALDGTPFEAELSHDIKTFDQLRERPWALRHFRHEPRTYLTDDELDEFLRIPELEVF